MKKSRVLVWTALGWLLIFSVAEGIEIRYDKADRRDPFAPQTGVTDTAGTGELSVEGIVFDPKGSSYALIRDQIVREGESVGGAQVIKILPDRVIFSQESQEVVVWLREEAANQAPDEAFQQNQPTEVT